MNMKRVVITGTGIVSCIGNDAATVTTALREGKSGIRAMPQFTELGMRSQVAGVPQIDLEALIDRKQLRFMGDAAAYAHISLANAIAESGLTPAQVSHPRTGLIMGSGGGSPANQIEAADILRSKGIRRVGPYQVTRCMSSTVSACLSTNFAIKGINYSITSACSTSAHCIGAAAQQIAWGMQDVMFAGGGEEVTWGMGLLFDAMGAMSSATAPTVPKYFPRRSSLPFHACCSRCCASRSCMRRASVENQPFGTRSMPGCVSANCSAPSPIRKTCGESSSTRRANRTGWRTVMTPATAPARRWRPSMIDASSSCRPSAVNTAPRPALK